MSALPDAAGTGNGSRPRPAPEAPAVRSIPPPQQLRLPGAMHRMGAVAMPLEKATDLRRAVRRLASRLRLERAGVTTILFLAVAGVTSSVLGPRVLGHGTDILVTGLRGGGRGGVDFGALHRVLLTVVALYVGASTLAYLQGLLLTGVVQRTMFRLRRDVETKLNRLPLRYIDQHARGDILSRVTNDIDNLAQSLQTTLSQMVTSVLTLVGTLTMMFVVSPVLALVATFTIPLSLLTMRFVARRSRTRFIAQWQETGALNALVEETFTGHAVVKAFGRQHEVEDRFRALNEELYESSFGAQFLSGSIQPLMMVIGNLNFVAIAVIGGLRVASGSMTIGDVQAFIQYSRHFTHPLTQIASVVNVFQSGIASAERIFEFLDAEEQSPDCGDAVIAAPVCGRIDFEHVTFPTTRPAR
jgi:ATP-binding cassette subfamily B protein